MAGWLDPPGHEDWQLTFFLHFPMPEGCPGPEALYHYTCCLELSPENPSYYGNRAACHWMLKQYADCLQDSLEATRLDPRYYKGYARCGGGGVCLLFASHNWYSGTAGTRFTKLSSLRSEVLLFVRAFQHAMPPNSWI